MSRLPLSMRIARKVGALRALNFTAATTVTGRRYRVPVRGQLGWRNTQPGGNDPWREPLMRAALGAPGAFLDVGANVGQTLMHVLALDPGRRYVGCEPNAACVDYLHRLVDANNLSGCTIVPTGLSDRNGLLTLHDHGDHSAIASVVDGFRPESFYTRTVHVAVLRGDAVADSLGIEKLAAVKVDVEGGELEVMSGLTETLKRDRPPVFCEILPVLEPGHDTDALHDFRSDRQNRLLAHMRELGYRCWRTRHDGVVEPIDPQTGIEPHADLSKCDYLFLRTESAEEFLAAAGASVASVS
ncbi:FkbM family methyltransferase [Alienimonas sp. DA493]|uniref:FkbM family methyltransferase n=1 Tax=Alienimonas sp. DA493 TaxID=3373605 RepID=UPI00375432B8